MKSSINDNMNDPGLRYYNLWDVNEDSNGNINRVGKVFPDYKMVIIDDDEIIAAMSYKSNRNWTLPAPKLSLINPNICSGFNDEDNGLLSAETETLWVTYRFNNT